jgi:hypothetical protein
MSIVPTSGVRVEVSGLTAVVVMVTSLVVG